MKRIPKNELEDRILNEVMAESFAMGPGNVSTKKVAAKVGISEPAIFAHYPTKQALLNAAFVKAWATLNYEPTFDYDSYPVNPEVGFSIKIDEEVQRLLSHPQEVAFISHYMSSGYYDFRLYKMVTSEYQAKLEAIFHEVMPKVSPRDLDFVSGLYLDARIRCLYFIVEGIIPNTPHDRQLLSNFLAAGVKYALSNASTIDK